MRSYPQLQYNIIINTSNKRCKLSVFIGIKIIYV